MLTNPTRLPTRPAICRDMIAASLTFMRPHAVRFAVGIQIMLAMAARVASL